MCKMENELILKKTRIMKVKIEKFAFLPNIKVKIFFVISGDVFK